MFVEALSNCSPFGVSLSIEGDGLVRRAIYSLARQTSDEIGELRRVRKRISFLKLLVKGLVSLLVASRPNLPLENGDLRIPRIRGT